PAVAFDGPSSVRFSLDNANGRGKIWLERTFVLSPRGRYAAHLDFAVRSSKDAVASDQLIARVLPSPPRTAHPPQPALSRPAVAGTGWSTGTFDRQMGGDAATVVIGIWNARPGLLVDYLAAVTVLFTER